MTKNQQQFIEEIKQQRLRPDYAGSMYPLSDDPHGDVQRAMKKIGKATGMKFQVTANFVSLRKRRVNPRNN